MREGILTNAATTSRLIFSGEVSTLAQNDQLLYQSSTTKKIRRFALDGPGGRWTVLVLISYALTHRTDGTERAQGAQDLIPEAVRLLPRNTGISAIAIALTSVVPNQRQHVEYRVGA
jgi:hypothetical protein